MHPLYPTFDLLTDRTLLAFEEDEKGPTCFALNKPVLAGVNIDITLTGLKQETNGN